MLTAGVICEFDPFHNGHAYLFEKIRQDLGAQRIVCVMSGAFTQRGAISGWDKFDRARAAVCCGADLVIELCRQFRGLFCKGRRKDARQPRMRDSSGVRQRDRRS